MVWTGWKPILRQGKQAAEAQDLTQAFFARLLEKDYLQAADQEKGRFRTNVLVLMAAILAVFWQIRGGEGLGLPAVPEIAIIAGPSILGIGMLLGAVHMLTLRRHSTAMLGAALAAVPCSPLWVLSVAFGVWGMLTLSRDDVKQHFNR